MPPMRLPGAKFKFSLHFLYCQKILYIVTSYKVFISYISVLRCFLCTFLCRIWTACTEFTSGRRIRRRRKISAQMIRSLFLVGSGTGIADISAFVYGCSGLSKISFLSAISTIFPRYITATRLLMYSTTDKSCEMKM